MSPQLGTYTGHFVDPLDLQPQDVRPADIAQSLSNTFRWGGHASPGFTVAQHSVFVSELAAPFGPKVALWGLLHDAAEAYFGDIQAPLKKHLRVMGPDQRLMTFNEAEQAALAVIVPLFGLEIDEPGQVHHADMVSLATEGRDLFDPFIIFSAGPPPHAKKITPLAPEKAAVAWLQRLVELLEEINDPKARPMLGLARRELYRRDPDNPALTGLLAQAG